MDCIFCKIADGSMPSTKVYEKGGVLGFSDVTPQARVHVLFIHKHHESNAAALAKHNPAHVGEVFAAIGEYAQQVGIADTGYRVITNAGKDGGQSVFHAHFHVLGGENMGRLRS